jgi:hypothetical protein
MAKISELNAITAITDSDLIMITDAETSASKKVTWANAKLSINSKLTIKGDTDDSVKLILSQATDASDAPDLVFRKARGTVNTPTSVQSGDVQMRIHAYGHDGTEYIQGGNMGFISTDADANGRFDLRTRVSGTLASRFGVDSNGDTLVSQDLILNPSSSVTPASNGQLMIEATSDTSLTFKYKGSDGTVRSVTVALS